MSPRLRKLIAGAAVGLAVGLVAAVAASTRPLFLERGELWTHDVRARSAADGERASGDIVFIDIGEQDIEDAENNLDLSWPWPRALYGYLAAYCAKAGARAVVFDWLFQDRGQYSVSDAEEFAQAMRDAGNVVIGLALTRRMLVARAPEGDWGAVLRQFPTRAEAERAAVRLSAWNVRSFLVGGGPTTLLYGGKKTREDVLAVHRRVSGVDELADLFAAPAADGAEPQPLPPPEPRTLTAEEKAAEQTAAAIIAARDGLDVPGAGDLHIQTRDAMDPPLAIIAAAPFHAGNVYQDADADGIMRRHSPLVRHQGRYYPSLALAAWLVDHRDTRPAIDDGALVLGDRRVPLDDEGRMVIRFHGARIYHHLPAWEVLRSQALIDEGKPPSVPPDTFKDKYVIVSASAAALRDIRISPVSKVHEGAEIQANALDNLLAGDAIRRSSPATDALIALLLALAAALAITALWSAFRRLLLASLSVLAALVILVTGYFYLAGVLYDGGLWVAVAIPGGGAIASAFAALLVTVAGERRNRRFVQEAFGRYTSADLVREIVEHPEYLSLEWGEKREMSVYFSDIAGFTTISEGLVPEQLVALLNDYLTQMTDLVMQHGGYVDKYIGDALMAIWGAPIKEKDHALKAVRCALAMRRKSDELRAGWRERYGHEVFARAGVNSGDAVVGNMGSKQKYNYTVMGDMVNLASRLEGANKAYGTALMIGETTAAKVGGAFDLRELDLIAVKGKEHPVRVFEVLDEAGRAPESQRRAVVEFEKGLALYRKRDFAAAIAGFEAALVAHPGDPPSLVYIDRCRHFLDDPPGEDWDGVWRMKEK